VGYHEGPIWGHKDKGYFRCFDPPYGWHSCPFDGVLAKRPRVWSGLWHHRSRYRRSKSREGQKTSPAVMPALPMSGGVKMSPSPKPIAPNPRPLDEGVSIGHVHLKVADLDRAIAFYCERAWL